jgi:hypothetical protein
MQGDSHFILKMEAEEDLDLNPGGFLTVLEVKCQNGSLTQTTADIYESFHIYSTDDNFSVSFAPYS